MTEPVRCRPAPLPDVDTMMRTVTNGRADVSVSAPPPRVPPEPGLLATAEHHALEHAVFHALHVSERVSVPLGVIAALVGGAASELERAEGPVNQRMHHDQMRGALAYFEGRSGAPEVLAEARRNPAYAGGLNLAAKYAATHDASAIIEGVRTAGRAGQDAVFTGEDRGPAFQRRFETNLAFRHGVEFARRERENDPETFAAHAARARELGSQLDAQRGATCGRI